MDDKMKNNLRYSLHHYEYEQAFEWKKWMREIPDIQFPADWKIRIIPPFANAIARFRVYANDKEISIYLDCYDMLGFFGSPYWEIYPYSNDIYRVEMNDVSELINRIQMVIDGKDNYDNEEE